MDGAALVVAIVGLVVSVLGFSAAVYQIRKTRSAAERAAAAADSARDSLLKVISVSDLSSASGQIDLLKQLHQYQEFERAVDRYTPLRQLLTVARARLPQERAPVFTQAIHQLRVMEEETRNALAEGRMLSRRRVNRILLEIQQTLDEARAELERFLGGNLEGKG